MVVVVNESRNTDSIKKQRKLTTRNTQKWTDFSLRRQPIIVTTTIPSHGRLSRLGILE
jgi:hypothetical protein